MMVHFFFIWCFQKTPIRNKGIRIISVPIIINYRKVKMQNIIKKNEDCDDATLLLTVTCILLRQRMYMSQCAGEVSIQGCGR